MIGSRTDAGIAGNAEGAWVLLDAGMDGLPLIAGTGVVDIDVELEAAVGRGVSEGVYALGSCLIGG